ncbi:MAG: hypothetical protein ABUK01_04400 [Leptospirales bacterium]
MKKYILFAVLFVVLPMCSKTAQSEADQVFKNLEPRKTVKDLSEHMSVEEMLGVIHCRIT